MGIARGTTPTFTLTFADNSLDLTQATSVYVTFEQGKRSITKTGDDLTVAEKQIQIMLSQEDTLSLAEGPVRIQANWMMPNDTRACSNVKTCVLTEQLLRAVIE